MDRLAAHFSHDCTSAFPYVDNRFACFDADFIYDPEDVSRCCGGFRAHDKIGASEIIEVDGMILEHENIIKQFTDRFCGRCRLDIPERVERFCRCHVVRRGADTADSRGNLRHIFRRPADTERLETAQFWHLKKRPIHIAAVIEHYGYFAVALQTGNWIYSYRSSH